MSMSNAASRRPLLWLASFEAAALAAIFVFTLLDFRRTVTSYVAITATVLLITAWLLPVRSFGKDLGMRLAVIASAVGIAGCTLSLSGIGFNPWINFPAQPGAALLPWAAAALIVAHGVLRLMRVPDVTVRWVIAVAAAAFVVALGTVHIHDRWPPIDVMLIHNSAAEVLAEGRNPYTDARAPNTSPLADPDAEFEGYVYPPTTLLAFAGSGLTFGDPRWATVIALVGFTAIVIAPWKRVSVYSGTARAALVLAFLAQPALPFFLNRGWTDLIALPFVAASASLWTRRPLVAAALLGLACSSKEYYLFIMPMLLLWPDEFRWRRLGVVVGVVAATYAPFLLLDPSSMAGSSLGAAASAPYRPDSLGLAGLGVNTPRIVSYALSFGMAALVGIRGGRRERFFVGMSAVLAIGFATGFQAFINYWLLVVGMAVVALVALVERMDDEIPDGDLATGADDTLRDNPALHL